MSYDIIWEYDVAPAQRPAFAAAYGKDGAWAKLFAQAEGFIEVRLLACAERMGRYLTIDRWRAPADYELFQQRFAASYQVLDRRLEGLAFRETRLGAFISD